MVLLVLELLQKRSFLNKERNNMIILQKTISTFFHTLLITSLITGSAFAHQEHHDKHAPKQSEATRLVKFCVGAACIGGSAFSFIKAKSYFNTSRLCNALNYIKGPSSDVLEQARLEAKGKGGVCALSGLVLGGVGLGLVISSMRK